MLWAIYRPTILHSDMTLDQVNKLLTDPATPRERPELAPFCDERAKLGKVCCSRKKLLIDLLRRALSVIGEHEEPQEQQSSVAVAAHPLEMLTPVRPPELTEAQKLLSVRAPICRHCTYCHIERGTWTCTYAGSNKRLNSAMRAAEESCPMNPPKWVATLGAVAI